MYSVRLRAIKMVSTAPIIVTAPDDAKSIVLPENKYLPLNYFEGEFGNIERDRNQTITGVPFTLEKPYVRGASFRGSLRNQTAFYAIELAQQAGHPDLDVVSANVNFVGGIKDKVGISVQERQKITERNPVIGLFGGAQPDFIPGLVAIGHMFPKEEDFRLDNMYVVRKSAVDNDNSIYALMTDSHTDASADENAANRKARKEIDTVKKEKLAAIKEMPSSTKEEKAEKKRLEKEVYKEYDEKNADIPVDMAQLHGQMLAIPAGINFDHTIRVGRGATDIELGLLINGLRRFRSRARIGGKTAVGCGGYLDLDYLIEIENASGVFEPDGTLDAPGENTLRWMAAFVDAAPTRNYMFR